ncbi:glutathione S-transferase [Gallaecimonas mangrovi]|uniref:glutathione S-transferase n=1 Tax=Gallaecimonas mangrovi TaxID=2291597 RepID=UPI000E1FF9AB|nr:glutathione S-transferase [Gallaecimonas mangrovi]
MLILHHLELSRSHRILWLLEILGVPYQVQTYKRDPKTLLAPATLKEIHPLGKSPVLQDGDNVIAESGAIIEYLVDRYSDGQLRPTEGQALLEYRYWLHYAEGSLMPLLVMKLVFSRIPKSPMPIFIKPIANKLMAKVQKAFLAPQLKTHMDYIENHLADRQWFAGEFSAADIQMSFPLEAASNRLDLKHYPNIAAFIERCRKLEQYQNAEKKGGPVVLEAN